MWRPVPRAAWPRATTTTTARAVAHRKVPAMSEVRDTATVIVSEPISGFRRGRGKDRGQRINSGVTTIKVHPEVWAYAKAEVAKETCPYTRIDVVDETTVVLR